MVMEYRELMANAAKIFNDRNALYGDMRVCLDRTAQIATLITGIHLTPHDVALVLHALKLARLGNDRSNEENYVDGINYYAFAGELISAQHEHAALNTAIEQSVSDELEKLRATVNPAHLDTHY
jgi:hypothetical protein